MDCVTACGCTSPVEQAQLATHLKHLPQIMDGLKKFGDRMVDILGDHGALSQELLASMELVLTLPSWLHSYESRFEIQKAIVQVQPEVQKLSKLLESYIQHLQQVQANLNRTDEKIQTFTSAVGTLARLTGAGE
ncbi:unnamed protein product [Calicophoron daubneyi]|uniref:Uncharacterized protein n=1 Tax=Calicophoron daubneyi TaxID=300641 RepID=A0AAV2T7V1_CALDB